MARRIATANSRRACTIRCSKCKPCGSTPRTSCAPTCAAGRPAMPKRVVSLPREPAALDIVSHGRRGPAAGPLAPEQVEQIKRTVRRTPEVMVKVSGGARDAGGAKAHFDYIDRHGKQAIVTDDG